MVKRLTKSIMFVATWIASPRGFMWCMNVLVVGGLIGVAVGFSDRWLLFYNLYLSIAATVQGNLILVAGRKSEHALHSKIDELIRSKRSADNRYIGIENDDEEVPAVA